MPGSARKCFKIDSNDFKSSNDYILNTYDYTNIIDIFLKTILDKTLFESKLKNISVRLNRKFR